MLQQGGTIYTPEERRIGLSAGTTLVDASGRGSAGTGCFDGLLLPGVLVSRLAASSIQTFARTPPVELN